VRVFLRRLEVVTRQTTEVVAFHQLTFLHGPVGSGKSTVARLIDFCFGGDLIPTPALQSEFIAARLFLIVGDYALVLERDAGESAEVRATWQPSLVDEKVAIATDAEPSDEEIALAVENVLSTHSALVPLSAEKGTSLIEGAQVENLSDLIFHLGGVTPIKVRRSKRDPDSKLVRLGFRDLLFYCYLDQDGLDSSFFSFEHPFKRQKSIDALRFIVGFHSERLNELEQRLYKTIEEQRSKRAAAEQLERMLKELQFENDAQIVDQLQRLSAERVVLLRDLAALEEARRETSHPLDELRDRLRDLSSRLELEDRALAHMVEKLDAREALRGELLTAKVKALRANVATRVLSQVSFKRCPQCETPLREGRYDPGRCSLCGQNPEVPAAFEELASEFDQRTDEVQDLIVRQRSEIKTQEERVARLKSTKRELDARLNAEAGRYDSAFVSRLRELERGIAANGERERHLQHLRRLPASLEVLLRDAGSLQGSIDATRKAIEEETNRLRSAQTVVQEIAERFRCLLLAVEFPGVKPTDHVAIDTGSWEPMVSTGSITWGFDTAGSGGKKVLFKVLYALALHEVAGERGLPLPTMLIVDSATKNISRDVNPELFAAFYREVYRVSSRHGREYQFLLIDSKLVPPPTDFEGEFLPRLLDHSADAPPLISYYRGA
jgi:rubrerythrin